MHVLLVNILSSITYLKQVVTATTEESWLVAGSGKMASSYQHQSQQQAGEDVWLWSINSLSFSTSILCTFHVCVWLKTFMQKKIKICLVIRLETNLNIPPKRDNDCFYSSVARIYKCVLQRCKDLWPPTWCTFFFTVFIVFYIIHLTCSSLFRHWVVMDLS